MNMDYISIWIQNRFRHTRKIKLILETNFEIKNILYNWKNMVEIKNSFFGQFFNLPLKEWKPKLHNKGYITNDILYYIGGVSE